MVFRLENEGVRDLSWIIGGPNLLDSSCERFAGRVITDEECRGWLSQGQDWFRDLDAEPSSLRDALAGKLEATARLGRYFEALLAFWIEKYLTPAVFATSLTVRGARETLGEFDFIFRERNKVESEHWEASVKFYLCAARNETEVNDPRFYVGTMLHDRLDVKLDRLFSRQLKLGELPDGKKILEKLGLSSPRARAWVKGFLFYPADRADLRNLPPPQGVSPFHGRGWWTSAADLHLLESSVCSVGSTNSGKSRWVILPKSRWLSPARVSSNSSSFNDEFVGSMDRASMMTYCRENFEKHRSPLMLAELARSPDEPGIWEEVGRGVIVKPGWFEAARLAASKVSGS